jgi:FkbM family methyltransferase
MLPKRANWPGQLPEIFLSDSLRFSEAEIRLFEQLKSFGYAPEVIYDIGASNGMWSAVINPVFPNASYHLFEPLADAMSTYSESLAKVLPAHPNFHLHRIGLGAENETKEMAIFSGGFGSTFLEIDRIKSIQDSLKASSRLDEIASFPVRRLDDFVAEKQIPHPQIVKIDTQGFEVAIIEGGRETMRRADILLLETWLYRGYGVTTPLLHELMEPVTELGFVLVDFGDVYWAAKHKLTSIDAIFMREDFLDKIETSTDGWKWRIWK